MGLFGSIVKTVINVATLPVDVLKDVGDVVAGDPPRNISEKIQLIKDEASDD